MFGYRFQNVAGGRFELDERVEMADARQAVSEAMGDREYERRGREVMPEILDSERNEDWMEYYQDQIR